jgi:hypothetical protein
VRTSSNVMPATLRDMLMSSLEYQIFVYVDPEHAEALKEAMFAAGAGRIGAYSGCAWQCEGTGQFRPGTDARPFIGSVGGDERVRELRIEMLCSGKCLDGVLAALRAAHPYEEPAFGVLRLEPVA